MATQTEYNAVAAALLKIIAADENANVPGWARGMIPQDAAPHLAAQCAKVAVDALDALRSHP
jgi:hypothetical protein